MQFSVLTTIQGPTDSVSTLVRFGKQFGIPLLAVGDRKSPYCELARGKRVLFARLPAFNGLQTVRNCYQQTTTAERTSAISKRLRAGPRFFSIPTMTTLHLPHWRPRACTLKLDKFEHNGWVNVYRWFSSRFIWPRGIPLEYLQECQRAKVDAGSARSCRMPDPAGACERLTRRGCRLALDVRSRSSISTRHQVSGWRRARGVPSIVKVPGGSERHFLCCICPALSASA